MEIVRAQMVRLRREGDQVCALIGLDLVAGLAGYGFTPQDALRDLADQIEERAHEVTVWVPRPAVQYRENTVSSLKAACPECGSVKEFSHFDRVIAYVCDACGAGNDVQGLDDS